MDWVSMENELPSLHKMWSLQVRAQVRGKSVMELLWFTAEELVLMAQWGFEGACLHWEPGEQTCLAGTQPIPWKFQVEPTLCPVPCVMGPVGRVASWHRPLSPSQAHCSHAQSSLCSSDVSKPSLDVAEHRVRERDPEAKVGLNHCPGLNRAKFGLL